jgi:hypothetical protein
VHGGKGYGLSPPIRVSAITNKRVYQRVIEFAGTYQVGAKFDDCLRPVIDPWRAAVVNRGFCRSRLFSLNPMLQVSAPEHAQCNNRSRARATTQATPPRMVAPRRLGNTDRKKIGLNKKERAARPQACDKIQNRRLGVRNMMKHSARCHEVEAIALHGPCNDVALAQLKV